MYLYINNLQHQALNRISNIPNILNSFGIQNVGLNFAAQNHRTLISSLYCDSLDEDKQIVLFGREPQAIAWTLIIIWPDDMNGKLTWILKHLSGLYLQICAVCLIFFAWPAIQIGNARVPSCRHSHHTTISKVITIKMITLWHEQRIYWMMRCQQHHTHTHSTTQNPIIL